MRRVYRRQQKLRTGIFRGWVLLAVLILAACLWNAFPVKTVRTLTVRLIGRSQPTIIKYAVHMETPRMSLLERLLSPQLFSYSYRAASSGGMAAETDGEAVNKVDTHFALALEADADLLHENIHGQTDLETAGDAQDSVVSPGSDSASDSASAASNLTVFDEITGQDETGKFSPVKQQTFNLADYDSLEALIKEFYVVDSSTQATASLINLESLTSYDCTISREDPAPQILIYHSHSQEAYIDSDTDDPSTTIVGVGEHLAELLEGYGYSVLHHEGTYDVPSRDDAYSKALPAIEALLEEYPGIEVVIDLHRDAVAEGTKLVYTYEGKDYARFMFFNGISRTASGPIDYLYNENLSANLAFSFQAQVTAESYFPGVTRGIYLKAWRYNMHLMPKYMLIELGAQTNTVEEAMNACEILAFVLDQVLSGGE